MTAMMDKVLAVLLSPLGIVALTWLVTQVVKLKVFTALNIADKSSIAIKAVSWTVAAILVIVTNLVGHQPVTLATLFNGSGVIAMTLMTALTAQRAHDVGSTLTGN